ncbi:MAG: heavy metal translocating P-type ATPase [Lentimonas sp.]
MASNSTRTVVCTTDDQSCDALDQQLARSWLRIAIAGVFAGQGMVFSLAVNMTPPLFASTAYWVLHGGLIFSAVIVMLFLGGPLFRSTFGMLRTRRLSIEGLFTLSLIGAFIGSLASSLTGEGGVYYEVVSIVIAIYTVGRMLSERSRTRLALESDRLREEYNFATIVNDDGAVEQVDVAGVERRARVRVYPGEPFTVDGLLVSGHGYVREIALTGEPLPVVRRVGDRVRAGTWSVDGVFELEVEATKGARELDQILDTVESVVGEPSEMQLQANRLMRWFLPLVAVVSLLTAVYWIFADGWVEAIFNSMAVLLVACPCAMGLATPVAIWQGLYRLAQMGLVSRNGSLIDVLARTQHVFFDKTGTLSEADMRVTEQVIAREFEDEQGELLATIRRVQDRVPHPIARALLRWLPSESPGGVRDIELLPGQGVSAQAEVSGRTWRICIGEPSLVDAEFSDRYLELINHLLEKEAKRTVATLDGFPVAVFAMRELPREGVDSLWKQWKNQRIRATVLTGDPEPRFDLPDWVNLQAGLAASEKAERVEQSRQIGEAPLVVGDGVNDAAAMRHASASIAMGSGARFVQSAATGQLTSDQIKVLPAAIELSRGIVRRLRGNLVYAASYNVIGMALAAIGLLHPVAAAAIMLISSFLVTARALRFPESSILGLED